MTKKELFSNLKSPKSTDKILLLTHTDMDAAGAIILLKTAFENVDTKLCSTKTMDYDIRQTLTSNDIVNKYDIILACDISCSQETADIIDKNNNAQKFVLLDHHTSATYLNNYKWARVQSDLISDSYRKTEYYHDLNGHSSGTSLMFDYLDFNGFTKHFTNLPFVKLLTHMIASYDTWDWVEVFDSDEKINDLNKLCDLYGVDNFAKIMKTKMENDTPIFDEMENMLLTVEKEKISSYISRVECNFKTGNLQINNKSYSIITSHSDEYIQSVFARMKELHPNHDLYLVRYSNGISIRTDTDLDVSKFASQYGGGGHKGAGGISIPQDVLQTQLESILMGTIHYD